MRTPSALPQIINRMLVTLQSLGEEACYTEAEGCVLYIENLKDSVRVTIAAANSLPGERMRSAAARVSLLLA